MESGLGKSVIPRHGFIGWLAVMDGLATKVRLHKWNVLNSIV